MIVICAMPNHDGILLGYHIKFFRRPQILKRPSEKLNQSIPVIGMTRAARIKDFTIIGILATPVKSFPFCFLQIIITFCTIAFTATSNRTASIANFRHLTTTFTISMQWILTASCFNAVCQCLFIGGTVTFGIVFRISHRIIGRIVVNSSPTVRYFINPLCRNRTVCPAPCQIRTLNTGIHHRIIDGIQPFGRDKST